jgi:hypothetical protein
MSITDCQTCGGRHCWYWHEAFAKFGFGDGDGQVETDTVAEVLIEAGYAVQTRQWGLHNTVIVSIKQDGAELIPHADIRFGYDDPSGYLPEALVALLNKAFPSVEHPFWLF